MWRNRLTGERAGKLIVLSRMFKEKMEETVEQSSEVSVSGVLDDLE